MLILSLQLKAAQPVHTCYEKLAQRCCLNLITALKNPARSVSLASSLAIAHSSTCTCLQNRKQEKKRETKRQEEDKCREQTRPRTTSDLPLETPSFRSASCSRLLRARCYTFQHEEVGKREKKEEEEEEEQWRVRWKRWRGRRGKPE